MKLLILLAFVTGCSSARRLERADELAAEVGEYACALCACVQAAQAIRRALPPPAPPAPIDTPPPPAAGHPPPTPVGGGTLPPAGE